MTNEDKAKEIVNEQWQWIADFIEKNNLSKEDRNQIRFKMYNALLYMARWKDEQYKEKEEGLRETINALGARLQKANEYGMYYFDQCNIQKQQLIEKACEWLKTNIYEGTCEQILSKKPYPFMRDFITDFKQAMKGGGE